MVSFDIYVCVYVYMCVYMYMYMYMSVDREESNATLF